MRTVLIAARLWDGSRLTSHPQVVIEDGKIGSITSREAAPLPAGAEVLDFPSATLAPAFFDVHIHGAAGHDLMEATPQALDAITGFLASHGTGSFLATTVTSPLDVTLRAVEGLAKLLAEPPHPGHARPLGIHLEGPFLSHARRGAQPAEHLLAPDISIFDRLVDAAEGHVKLITLAPELPGAVELTAHATSRGVRVSLGHSDATAAQTRLAIAAGAVSTTHIFNGMRPLHHHEPGILGVMLTNDAMYAELICDGIHSQPEIVSLWWRAKGPERAILITDAMSATGMPDGEYLLGGFPVLVAAGRAVVKDAPTDGTLAGSVLTLDRALVNFVQFTGATVPQGLRLLTANPAAMTGLSGQTGALAVGMPASLVAVDAAGRLVGSVVGGQSVR